jgi:serine protease Do
VFTPDGFILTNHHVVSGASTLQVKFKSGNTVNARVVGTDSMDDLALIGVDPASVANLNQLTLVIPAP